jgi:hypothetical protein
MRVLFICLLAILFFSGFQYERIQRLQHVVEELEQKIIKYEDIKIPVSYKDNPCSPNISISTYNLLIDMNMDGMIKLCEKEIHKNKLVFFNKGIKLYF